jgi:hypothetical protein
MTNPSIRYDDHIMQIVFDDLPELTGSEKQVAWAQDIRRGMLQTQIAVPFGALITRANLAGQGANIAPAFVKLNDQMAHVLSLSSAKFWIDNKNVSLKSVGR